MQEMWVLSLGGEDPLEKEMATHSSVLAWRSTVHGVAKSQTQSDPDWAAKQQQKIYTPFIINSDCLVWNMLSFSWASSSA